MDRQPLPNPEPGIQAHAIWHMIRKGATEAEVLKVLSPHSPQELQLFLEELSRFEVQVRESAAHEQDLYRANPGQTMLLKLRCLATRIAAMVSPPPTASVALDSQLHQHVDGLLSGVGE
jgi:hypothetical protein